MATRMSPCSPPRWSRRPSPSSVAVLAILLAGHAAATTESGLRRSRQRNHSQWDADDDELRPARVSPALPEGELQPGARFLAHAAAPPAARPGPSAASGAVGLLGGASSVASFVRAPAAVVATVAAAAGQAASVATNVVAATGNAVAAMGSAVAAKVAAAALKHSVDMDIVRHASERANQPAFFFTCQEACYQCFTTNWQGCIAFCDEGCSDACTTRLSPEVCSQEEKRQERWSARVGFIYEAFGPRAMMCKETAVVDGCPRRLPSREPSIANATVDNPFVTYNPSLSSRDARHRSAMLQSGL